MKLEKFIFVRFFLISTFLLFVSNLSDFQDGLALAQNPCAFMVKREGNFAAVKNGPNQGLPDSPETARQAVTQYHMSLIQAAGGSFEIGGRIGSAAPLRDIPLISYNGEGLSDLVKGKRFKLPLYLTPQPSLN